MTGVSECSEQRGNLKDNGYKANDDIGFTYQMIFGKKCQISKIIRKDFSI
ncbi:MULTISPECIES: hypothetical protein [Photorhabdus]|nr:hypothetical protein [Photorhabdus asymbiotica]